MGVQVTIRRKMVNRHGQPRILSPDGHVGVPVRYEEITEHSYGKGRKKTKPPAQHENR